MSKARLSYKMYCLQIQIHVHSLLTPHVFFFEKVVVPMPSWEASTNKPLAKSKREVDKVRLFLQCYFHSSMNSPRVVNVFVFLFYSTRLKQI